jgi:hypothetical protein
MDSEYCGKSLNWFLTRIADAASFPATRQHASNTNKMISIEIRNCLY